MDLLNSRQVLTTCYCTPTTSTLHTARVLTKHKHCKLEEAAAYGTTSHSAQRWFTGCTNLNPSAIPALRYSSTAHFVHCSPRAGHPQKRHWQANISRAEYCKRDVRSRSSSRNRRLSRFVKQTSAQLPDIIRSNWRILVIQTHTESCSATSARHLQERLANISHTESCSATFATDPR